MIPSFCDGRPHPFVMGAGDKEGAKEAEEQDVLV
jgi:hypothetical protein